MTAFTDSSPIAVVTGAGSGIGRAVAVALAEAGYRVALAGRRVEALEETRGLLPEAARAHSFAASCDVADAAAVRGFFDAVVDRFGRLDVLFNNAGTGAPPIPLDELTVEQWRAVVDVNLTGVFLCLQQAFRIMKRQTPRGGRIINNGSISSYTPRPNSSPYTSTKHAVAGLTKAASLDGRAFDIAVGQIDIGNAATDMTARMRTGTLQANGTMAVEPVMDVDNVSRAVVHMASLPLSANVLFMTVMATAMPYVGRG